MSMLTNLPRKPTGANEHKGKGITVDNVNSDSLSKETIGRPTGKELSDNCATVAQLISQPSAQFSRHPRE